MKGLTVAAGLAVAVVLAIWSRGRCDTCGGWLCPVRVLGTDYLGD